MLALGGLKHWSIQGVFASTYSAAHDWWLNFRKNLFEQSVKLSFPGTFSHVIISSSSQFRSLYTCFPHLHMAMDASSWETHHNLVENSFPGPHTSQKKGHLPWNCEGKVYAQQQQEKLTFPSESRNDVGRRWQMVFFHERKPILEEAERKIWDWK